MIDYDREALENWPVEKMPEWHPRFHLVCPMFDEVFDSCKLIFENYRAVLEETGEPKEYLINHMKDEVVMWMSHWLDEIVDAVWEDEEQESEILRLHEDYPFIPWSNTNCITNLKQ
ncbi:MAG: hypothetical protein AAF215_32405 [Cyanobacteria bacterium P01_A01_bin.123]